MPARALASWDGEAFTIRALRDGVCTAAEAEEVEETLAMIAIAEATGAISAEFAAWLITELAEECVAKWLDTPRGSRV